MDAVETAFRSGGSQEAPASRLGLGAQHVRSRRKRAAGDLWHVSVECTTTISVGIQRPRVHDAIFQANIPGMPEDPYAGRKTSLISVAFYGVEGQVIGDAHFTQLRRCATDALIGKHKFASSYLAMQYISDKVMDPQLYVIVSGLCAICRLYHHHPSLAGEFWHKVLEEATPRGPASALAAYLRKLNWTPEENGVIFIPSGHQICLTHQPTREIMMVCRLAWSHYVHQQVCHRKGVTAAPFDVYTHLKLFQKLTPREQQLLSLNITGGYQTSAIKAVWDNTHTPECEFCSQPDTHQHRLLDCPQFAHVRANHLGAVQTLQTHSHLCKNTCIIA